MEREIWKDIPGYEGFYQVSNIGNVRSISHYQGKWNKVYKRKTPRILSRCMDTYGYYHVVLSKMGYIRQFTVHRLVAMAFIPNPNNLPQINHKDENKTNNFVFVNADGSANLEKSNLEWCTLKYNLTYGSFRERSSLAMRNCPSVSKSIMALYDDGKCITFPSMIEASRQLDISWSRIRRSAIRNAKVPNTDLTFKYL